MRFRGLRTIRRQAKKLARTAWCDHCEVRPRARGSRFCSPECADAEADANWSIR